MTASKTLQLLHCTLKHGELNMASLGQIRNRCKQPINQSKLEVHL